MCAFRWADICEWDLSDWVSVCVCVHDMEEMDMKQYGVFGEDMESITSAAGVADKEWGLQRDEREGAGRSVLGILEEER